MSAKNNAAIRSAADMQVVGCPLADAVVARIDSMRRRVAMFFSDDRSDASTCNRGPPETTRRQRKFISKMERCSLLRYLYVVALVLWVGGLVVAGALVAPSVFGVLQAWNESQGRVLAGQVFGEVLLRLTWLSYAMGGGHVHHADAASPARRAPAQVRHSRRHHGADAAS